jgi:ADP-heptose:LPS heptosyltransferase
MNEVANLLLRPDKAGDALKTLPAMRALRAKIAPGSLPLYILCSEHNASVFAFEPGIQVAALPPRWKTMRAASLLSALQQKGFPTHFDRAVNLLCDPFAEAEHLLRMVPAARKFSVPPSGAEDFGAPLRVLRLPDGPAGRDESLNIALLLSQAFDVDLTAELASRSAAPEFDTADFQEAQEKMGPKRGLWLGLCPFAGTTQRTHPLRRWEGFLPKITRLPDFQKFFLFGVPSDYSRLEKLRARCERADDIELCFPSSFRSLGAYLKRLDGVIAVDSGPLHLALALGIKSLGVLSGGDMERWFPRTGADDILIRRGLFNRFPTVFEMQRAYRKWAPAAPEIPSPAALSMSEA